MYIKTRSEIEQRESISAYPMIYEKVRVQIDVACHVQSPLLQLFVLAGSATQVATALPRVMLPPSLDPGFLYTQPFVRVIT